MTKDTQRTVAWGRIALSVVYVVVAGFFTWKFGDLLSNRPDTLGIIASIFSILAGVLIAVISILGDPGMLMDQTWRHSYLAARETQRKLHRKTDTFVLYIIILVGLFAFMLTDPTWDLYWVMQRGVFFLITIGFLSSLTLPYSLTAIQKQRLNDAIKSRRNETEARK